MRTDRSLLLLPAYFPYETMTSPIFELTFICQIIGLVYYTTAYTAVDTFLAMLILHVCEQLSRLRNDLIYLNSNTKDHDFQMQLNYIVERHNDLNRFVDTIEKRFNVMLLFEILGCTLQLCMECFHGLMSSELARAAYECKWYELLPNEARTLLLIIHRSRSPLRLTAGKFCILNHELYSTVLKTSMSYLSVLRATMTKNE
ncbi:hypothetical protein HZH68_004880 [Vespula germanica]|uniref:Uncharacterized protein n=1 Tax=Vespula germanica TaxID=30212 RepID=A0A834KM65_VESGE|nr:hypothetical protein HZH68_004880 [Vespula germanica]